MKGESEMKKAFKGMLALACLLNLAACGGRAAPESGEASDGGSTPENRFSVRVTCADQTVDQISYTTCVGGEFRTTGGQVILDRDDAEEETVFTLSFSPGDFKEGDDLSEFSISLAPVQPGERGNPAFTEPVAIPAEYEGEYTVLLSGDGESGYTAQLE